MREEYVQRGDVIIVNDGNEWIDKEMVVVEPHGVIAYKPYVGSHLIAKFEDENGVVYTCVVKDGHWTKKIKDLITAKDVEIYDLVKVPNTLGTSKKDVYVVIDKDENGIAYYDDLGNKRWERYENIEKVDASKYSNENLIDMIASLSHELVKLKKALIKSLELQNNAIKEALKYMNNQ